MVPHRDHSQSMSAGGAIRCPTTLTSPRLRGDNPPNMTETSPAPSTPIERIPLLGVCVDRVTMAQTMAILEAYILSGKPHHVVTLDASMCVLARTDSELRNIVLDADLVTPDSVGILWAARRMGHPLPERVSGVEIVGRMVELAAAKDWRVFLLGAKPGVAEEAARRIQQRYGDRCIAGVHHGYFPPEDDSAVAEMVRAASPDVLCVAMGIPKQEKWIARHKNRLGVPVMIGVGGTLDVLSGRVGRAPRWLQQWGLEWAYRVLRNPRKIAKVMTLPRFIAMVLGQRTQGVPNA